MAFGSSLRRAKTLISNPHCLVEVSPCGNESGHSLKEKSEVEPLKAVQSKTLVSLAAPIGGRNLLQVRPVQCPHVGGS